MRQSILASGKWSAIANTHVGLASARQVIFEISLVPDRTTGAFGFAAAQLALRSCPKDFERPFALPPLDEQQRIVAEIEKQFTRLDAGVGSLKRVQTALKRYRASVLKAACEGRLVPTEAELALKENRSYETGEQLLQRILEERRKKWNGKGKYKEPSSAQNLVDLPQLPKGWTWTRLEQLSGSTFGGLTKNPGSIPELRRPTSVFARREECLRKMGNSLR